MLRVSMLHAEPVIDSDMYVFGLVLAATVQILYLCFM